MADIRLRDTLVALASLPVTTNPWEELDSLGGRTKEELLDLLRRLDDVPRPARRHTQVYADEYAGHHYRRVRPDKFQCCMCEQTASSWDHCHPHNYVRGPLCGRCNNMESRWRAEGKFPAYFAKCPDCAP